MMSAEHAVRVDAGIDDVWEYVKDMRRWASIVPSCQSCTVLDEDDSRWILKLGVGGMVRTVKLRVHVDEWAGPAAVHFSFDVEGDPVEGRGSYTAESLGADATEIRMEVHISGKGPVAQMWEAMGGPVLQQFARAFADELKARIEGSVDGSRSAGESPLRVGSVLMAGIGEWLRSIWRRVFRRARVR